MEVKEREIEYYTTEKGISPFKNWFSALKDKGTRAKIQVRLDRLALGNLGQCAPVGEGVMELKINIGPGYRVYFGQVGAELVLLLSGGDKSTQPKDIKKAKEYWKDHRRHNG
jgi:putative addiction module killer protein